jgi:hypothetical protein
MILLKWIIEKYVLMWTGLILLITRCSGSFVDTILNLELCICRETLTISPTKNISVKTLNYGTNAVTQAMEKLL